MRPLNQVVAALYSGGQNRWPPPQTRTVPQTSVLHSFLRDNKAVFFQGFEAAIDPVVERGRSEFSPVVFCIDLAGEMLRYNVEVGPGLNDGIEIDRLRSGERKEKGVAGG